jgi:hypothetical protein
LALLLPHVQLAFVGVHRIGHDDKQKHGIALALPPALDDGKCHPTDHDRVPSLLGNGRSLALVEADAGHAHPIGRMNKR